MTGRLVPVARTGAGGADAVPLAGSASVWFDEVAIHRGSERLCVKDLADADRARLSARRPDLCGLTLERPRVMGILNVTPDSFSDGGDLATVAAAVARAEAMARDADILDIGGESTRPGAEPITVAEEIRRTAPVIRAIREAGITTPISIDTRKAGVAEAALDAGADMVNDVAAFSFDAELAGLVAERGVPVCLMHAKGTPATMQDAPHYDDVLGEVLDFLAERIAFAEAAGIARGNIITDPGIGFGKTQAHNLTLLRNLAAFHDLGVPVLLGASRKRFIGAIGAAPEARDRMAGSLAVSLDASARGVHILRVHDTRDTGQALKLWAALNGTG